MRMPLIGRSAAMASATVVAEAKKLLKKFGGRRLALKPY